MLYDRHSEHTGGRCTVDIAARGKNLHAPFFPCDPGKDSGFDGGKVCHIEPCALSGDECSTDELGQCIRHIPIQHLHRFQISLPYQCSRLCQIRQMVLRKVLHLNEAA